MAERGRLYRWPRNRSFGDSKPRPVLVIAPDAATRHGRRWVVLPLSTESGLAASPLAYRLDPTQANGLEDTSFVMAWQPTTVLAEALQLRGEVLLHLFLDRYFLHTHTHTHTHENMAPDTIARMRLSISNTIDQADVCE